MKQLRASPEKFYRERVLWDREDWFKDYFVIGSCIHKYIELYNNNEEPEDKIQFINKFLNKARQTHRQQLEDGEKPLERDRGNWFYQCKAGINNFLYMDLEPSEQAEFEFEVDVDDSEIPFVGAIDAITEASLIDRKTTKNFVKFNGRYSYNKLSKYWWQWLSYYYGYHKATGEWKDNVKFIEIKKTKPRSTNKIRVITFEYSQEDIELFKNEFHKSILKIKAMEWEWLILRSFEDAEPNYTEEEL